MDGTGDEFGGISWFPCSGLPPICVDAWIDVVMEKIFFRFGRGKMLGSCGGHIVSDSPEMEKE